MSESPAQSAARARAHRRKRLQQRQTVIFGSIIAVLLGVALFAGAVWAEIVPAPFTVELKTPEPEETPVVSQPCPPADALPVPMADITVNVMNSTQTVGLGARTADGIREHGVNVETIGNASELYLGAAKVLTGVEHLDAAYTVADMIPEAQIVLDARTEAIIDVVLGSGFTAVHTADELRLAPDEVIPAPANCIPIEQYIDDGADPVGEAEDDDGDGDDGDDGDGEPGEEG